MLSVGVIAAGGVGYYLDTVGSGVDDYYARADPGRWAGRGAAKMGLQGTVDAAQIDRLAAGHHPLSGEALGVRVGKVTAFDLTFSAPKSVSLMGELAGPDTRAQVLEAHRAAVAATVGFLEDEDVLVGRRGAGGSKQVTTTGAVAAAFVHRTSRAGDPQLHTHLLVFNRAHGTDGRWGGLDGRRLFGWAKTAGYVYQAALRAELTVRLGLDWQPVVNGTAELAGFTSSQVQAFSARRAAIEAELHLRGHDTARAAQVATLATRPAKPEPLEPSEQRAHWLEQAAAVGLDPDRMDSLLQRIGRSPAPDRHPGELAARLAGPAGLTEHRSAFDRRDVIRAVAEEAGRGLDPATVRDRAAAVLADPAFVATGADSRIGGPLHSTAELMRTEQEVLAAAPDRDHEGAAVCPPEIVNRAVAERPTLSSEQEHMVRTLCGSGRGVEVVVGRAGTGKTYALDAARAAWAAAGIPVVGAALAARTAAGLQADTGIASTTVDQVLTDLGRPGPDRGLPRRGVLVVDEAGMVGTRKLARLLDAAARSHTKVVLVGDPRQLPEVEAGGAFAALAARHPVELTANRRQAEPWERAALDELRHGDVTRAVTVYRDHQRIVLADTADAARAALVADWWQAYVDKGADRVAMIALQRSDVDDLNERPTLTIDGGREFAVGDEVMALRNDRRIGVQNGTRATVTRIDDTAGSLTVLTSAGQQVDIPSEYLDQGHLIHGYAMTAHKAQGLTTGRAFVLGSDRLYREAGYTALSRAVERTDLYQVALPPSGWEPATDPHRELARRLTRSAAQTLATEPDHPVDRAAIRDAALADLAALWPAAKEAKLLRWWVVTEHGATFAVRPGVDALRPPQRAPVDGLFFAGDWTATGWPATMEGAVRSGYLAAEGVLRDLGRPQPLLQPDLPPARLFRWLFGVDGESPIRT
jgi:conjugative relaxase-like TrwC/TraI family protein